MNGLLTLRTARGLAVGIALAGIVLATKGVPATTLGAQETTRSVKRALQRLPYYGVFDHLAFAVDRGTVTLSGYVYNGSLRSAAETAAKWSSGVDEVANRLEVLPASQEDDRIRWTTFYRIYTDAFLSRYAAGGPDRVWREIYEARRFPGSYQPFGSYSIHIVVRRGHTTLFGVVDNDGDRQIAEVRAREVAGVFSVGNEIVVKSHGKK